MDANATFAFHLSQMRYFVGVWIMFFWVDYNPSDGIIFYSFNIDFFLGLHFSIVLNSEGFSPCQELLAQFCNVTNNDSVLKIVLQSIYSINANQCISTSVQYSNDLKTYK